MIQRLLLLALFSVITVAAEPEARVIVIRDWSLTAPPDIHGEDVVTAEHSIIYLDFSALESRLGLYEGPRPSEFSANQPEVIKRKDRIAGQDAAWTIWKEQSDGREILKAEVIVECGHTAVPEIDFEYTDYFHIFISARNEKALATLQAVAKTLRKISAPSGGAQPPRRRVELPPSLAISEPARILGPTHIIAPEKYPAPPIPLEVTVDVSRVRDAAPYMERWAEHARALCKVWYPVLCAELHTEGFKPRQKIRLVFLPHHIFPAQYARAKGTIVISTDDLCEDPSNYGMIIHELAHAVQNYPPGSEAGWLGEGIADYLRYYLYEIDPLRGYTTERVEGAKYTDGYGTLAAFLDYLGRNYDPGIVKKLNRLLRQGIATEHRRSKKRSPTIRM
jgi:hypothetical protein